MDQYLASDHRLVRWSLKRTRGDDASPVPPSMQAYRAPSAWAADFPQ